MSFVYYLLWAVTSICFTIFGIGIAFVFLAKKSAGKPGWFPILSCTMNWLCALFYLGYMIMLQHYVISETHYLLPILNVIIGLILILLLRWQARLNISSASKIH